MRPLRSLLFVPVTKPRFYDSASRSGADGIILDLEDSVAVAEKEKARSMLEDAVAAVGRAGADVLVRINNQEPFMIEDLTAAVRPGISGIMVPKVESSLVVERLDQHVSSLEESAGLQPGSIYFEIDFESARGVVDARQIIGSSPRIANIGFGAGDYMRDLNLVPTAEGLEFLYAFSKLITLAWANGLHAKGLLGTLVDVRDLEGFERMAIRSRGLGSTGSACIHPRQVEILNRVFSPTQREVEWAQGVVQEFANRSKAGEAAFVLNGKMVDYGVYKQAKDILDTISKINERC